MPLPDERPRQSVANLIGRFEQQTKKQRSSSPGPRVSSVVSHTTGDSAKEEVKEKREWPPRISNVNSPPSDSRAGGREWAPRLSRQSSGDSPGQRWPPVQPTIQASPFTESKKTPTSPLAKSSELGSPEDDKPPSPPVEPPKVIEVTPPSRKHTVVEPEPPKLIEPEPVETPETPPQPTVAPPATKSAPSSVATKSPPRSVKTTPTKPNTKAPIKPPPSSFAKGTSLHADPNDRRTSTSARPSSRSASRTTLRSKTPTSSTPVRPSSSAQRKPPTETPSHTSTPIKRSKTPSTPSKPPPVIPKTPNSRLYAPTAASLAKSTNSPQPPLPERKKTLSSGASLERLSKPTASSLSKSKSAHSLTSTASPPKSTYTPTRTGTLITTKKATATNKSIGKTKATSSTALDNPVGKDDDLGQGHHGNGNGVAGDILLPAIDPSDAENHEQESDLEDEHLGNSSLEASYVEEPLETTDDASAHDHEEVVHPPVDRELVETPGDLVHSLSSESVDPTPSLHTEDGTTPESVHELEVNVDTAEDAEPKQEGVKDDIADIVGLLESTSFTSKHIMQGSDEGVANGSRTPGSDKDRQRIGEIPDEE